MVDTARLPLVAGNWKMNTLVDEGVALATEIIQGVADVEGAEVALLPPFTHLWPVHQVQRGSRVLLGAQDVYWENAGAFTGEVSPAMLAGWCDFVLVGHSERRHLFGETDEQVGMKFAKALEHGLRVIVAVGETESERDAEKTFEVVDRQLNAAFAPFDPPPGAELFVIAYEPVWAIGTGRNATPEQAQEVNAHIKEHLAGRFGISGVQVQYGGSVTAFNAGSLFSQPDVDGALVGGASLKSGEFTSIVAAAAAARATQLSQA